MKKFLLILSSTALFASASTELFTSYTKKDFENSKQKYEGYDFKLGAKTKLESSNLTFLYNKASNETYQPPLSDDLYVKKYSFKYERALNQNLGFFTSYIKIDDNLAPTDNGNIYSLGLNYKLNKSLDIKPSIYYSDYDKFSVKQANLEVVKKFKVNDIKSKIVAGVSYIDLEDKDSSGYTKNAKDSYTTPFIGITSNYKGYLLGAKKYFSKRAFSVMNEGLGVQHHSMEFNETYEVMLGKKFKNFDIVAKYNFQEATELPINNKDVEVESTTFMVKYRF